MDISPIQRILAQINSQNSKGQESVKPKTIYKCEKCRDLGWIIVPRENSNDLCIKCECMKLKEIKAEWKRAGFRVDMCNYTFSTFKVWNNASKFAKDVALKYFKSFESNRDKRTNSILLCGQVGSGKTHLAIALAVNFLEKKIKVQYMPYRDIVTEIKQNIIDSKNYTRLVDKYKTCDVLLIDDLYKGKINESDINIMFEIINYRYLNNKSMIISSEYTMDRILNVDEAIGSRIYEMCKNSIVQIENNISNNYRLK